MRRAAEYREEAAQCRAMAAKESNARIKATILELAQQFEALADQREQLLRAKGSA